MANVINGISLLFIFPTKHRKVFRNTYGATFSGALPYKQLTTVTDTIKITEIE